MRIVLDLQAHCSDRDGQVRIRKEIGMRIVYLRILQELAGFLGRSVRRNRFRGRAREFGEFTDGGTDDPFPLRVMEGTAELVGGNRNGFEESVCNVGKGNGIFGTDAASGDSSEKAGHGLREEAAV